MQAHIHTLTNVGALNTSQWQRESSNIKASTIPIFVEKPPARARVTLIIHTDGSGSNIEILASVDIVPHHAPSSRARSSQKKQAKGCRGGHGSTQRRHGGRTSRRSCLWLSVWYGGAEMRGSRGEKEDNEEAKKMSVN